MNSFPIILQSPSRDGYTFFRRIHADGSVEKKTLGMNWEPADNPRIDISRIDKYLYQMTKRLNWSQVEKDGAL